MTPRKVTRETAYLLCGILLFFACCFGAGAADTAAEPLKLSPDEIVHGLYQLKISPEKLAEEKERSVYFRDGLSELPPAERLYTLAEVYNDDAVSEYFSRKITENTVNGWGINRYGYILILLEESAVLEIEEIIAGFDQITEAYGVLPVMIHTGRFEVSTHPVIQNFVTAETDGITIQKPVYSGNLPPMSETAEETIRNTLYPYVLFLFTVLSVSGILLFSRRKNPEENADSTPAKILSYLQNHPPASQKKITKEVGVSRGSVRYQIHRLVREGKIFSAEILGRKFYSVSPIAEDKTIQSLISLFDDETDTKICLALFNEGEMSRADIAEKTEMSLDAVYYHLSRMGEDVAEKRIEKGTAYYRLTEKAKEWAAALNIH